MYTLLGGNSCCELTAFGICQGVGCRWCWCYRSDLVGVVLVSDLVGVVLVPGAIFRLILVRVLCPSLTLVQLLGEVRARWFDTLCGRPEWLARSGFHEFALVAV